MEESEIKKYFKHSENIKLSEQKKNLIYKDLLLFMKNNPAQVKKPILFFAFADVMFKNLRSKGAVAVLAGFLVFLSAGGFAVVKASNALPGDFLYPVKIGFNEKAIEILSFSEKSKIDFNIKTAELRLKEIEKLAVENKLDRAVKSDVNNNFKNSANKAYKAINKIRNEYVLKNSAEKPKAEVENIISEMESSFNAHTQILEDLKKENSPKELSNILSNVKEINGKISSVREAINVNASVKLDQNKAQKEQAIKERILQTENSVLKAMSQNNSAEMAKKIDIAKEKINKAKDDIKENSENYAKTVTALQEADIIAKESKKIIEEKNKLGIEINIEKKDD